MRSLFLRGLVAVLTSGAGGQRLSDSLSESAAVDLGDGGGHGAADARAGWGTLGNRRDAVRRVLTGW